MLNELRIRNFTIIDALSVGFGPGFNVLTGETGAGKSIVVDAIGLLLGDKASPDLVRTGAKEAILEAFFDAPADPLLEELSIDCRDGITKRRTIPAHGKGRTFINDTAVSLQTLAEIGKGLIDIHGQNEHQGLLKKETHLLFLDSFAALTDEARELAKLYEEVSSLRARIAEMREKVMERERRMEFLRFQINEIDSAGLKTGERETLEEERAILLNLGKLREASETIYNLLHSSDNSCEAQLSVALARAGDMARIDGEARELLELLEAAAPLVSDAAIAIRNIKDKYDLDPSRLDKLEERLDLIKKLEKKYGEGFAAVSAFRDKAQEELAGLEHIGDSMEELEETLKARDAELSDVARQLSQKRRAAAAVMQSRIAGELLELGFDKATFGVDFRERTSVSAHGLDDVEFLFSANPGEPPRSLQKVASGGELSRIMLALKCIETAPAAKTLIFDEVDAGIGGVTARHVGERLRKISAGFQVLCITHLPQIAAMADRHLKVEKSISGDTVKVSLRMLTGEERRREIARMLSGKITENSLLHADELLKR
jgi:DNA repair protein RecN (Recombination protein N)